MTQAVCDLCNATGDVEYRWAWYSDSREPVQMVWRCRNEDACRERVKATGGDWPLRERVMA